jgi:hypothetical protein
MSPVYTAKQKKGTRQQAKPHVSTKGKFKDSGFPLIFENARE